MRLRQIDILRAIAILLVLGRHGTPSPSSDSAVLSWITWRWYHGGWIGVDLFFVLSGFLVSGLLFREYASRGKIGSWLFLLRRAFKIYPAFWVMIGVTVLVTTFSDRFKAEGSLWAELLFVQNYVHGLWGHTWSLAVEEHFYLLLVLLFVVMTWKPRADSRSNLRAIPWVFAIVAVTCLALRIIFRFRYGYRYLALLLPTHFRIDSLMFGVVLSYWYHQNPVAAVRWCGRYRYPLLAVGTAMLLPAFFYRVDQSDFIPTFGLTIFYLGSGLLLLGALGMPTPTGWLSRGLAYVGSHSYSIYLWHAMVGSWFLVLAAGWMGKSWNWYVQTPIYFLASIGGGILISLAVEFPMLRLRDRYFPSRANIVVSPEIAASQPAAALV